MTRYLHTMYRIASAARHDRHTEHERVSVDHPLHGGELRVEIVLDRRDRDARRGEIVGDDEHRGAHRSQREDGAAVQTLGVGLHRRTLSWPPRDGSRLAHSNPLATAVSGSPYDGGMTSYLHTMYRITDPAKSRAFYEALGFQFSNEFDIVRDGKREATNYFFSLGAQENVLELTFNHDGRSYELGTAYGHIAIAVDDLDGTLARLAEQGIEPEREPYRVREGGSRLCFVNDPDDYRIELIDRSGK
jgi:lactoylglutathione lyase